MGDDAFFGTFAFVPVVDGTFITQRPTIALRQGKFNGIRIELYSVIKLTSYYRKLFSSLQIPSRVLPL